jgi:hypothetical protein
VAWRVTCVRLTVETVVALGAVVLVVRTLRRVTVVAEGAGAVSVVVAAGLVSAVAGVASVTGGGAVWVTGAGSVGCVT